MATVPRSPEHRVYPYLLKGVAIERPNHVWSADITYIPVQRGFLIDPADLEAGSARTPYRAAAPCARAGRGPAGFRAPRDEMLAC